MLSDDTVSTHDALGRQSSETDRLGHTTSFAYTVLGQLESLTDAESQTTNYRYDGYARQSEVSWPDHVPGSNPGDLGYGITTTEHDDLDRVTRTTDQLGDTVAMVYDTAGRLLKRNYRTRANSPSGTIADTDTFTYDAASRMLTAASGRYGNTVAYVYDASGRKLSESLSIGGQTYTTSTVYDAAGRVERLIYPDASEVTRTYTARGQLEKIITGGVDLNTRGYDDGGRMITSVYDNGVSESRTYNVDNTPSAINFTGAGIGNLTYGWDDNHNKTSETISGTMSDYGFTASYDAEDRLTGWDRADANLDQSWNLTPVGDWQKFTENSVVQNRTHGPAHELTAAGGQSVQHDAKGNMTLIPASLRFQTPLLPLSLTWDFDNRLKSADVGNNGSVDVEYQFDALGRRVSRDDGTTTVFVQNGQQTLADYASGASPSAPQYTYIWGDYIDELVVRDGTGGRRFYHRNAQYSIVALTNASGTITERYAYDAYGDLTITDASGTVRSTSADNNRYTYTGREWDETLDLCHFRARMYDPKAGRFIGRDPKEYDGGYANLYIYAGNRSLRSNDPFGMDDLDPTGGYDHCWSVGSRTRLDLPSLKFGKIPPVPSWWTLKADMKVSAQIRKKFCSECCDDGRKITDDITQLDISGFIRAELTLGLDLDYPTPLGGKLKGYIGFRGEGGAEFRGSGMLKTDRCNGVEDPETIICGSARPKVTGRIGGSLRYQTRWWSWEMATLEGFATGGFDFSYCMKCTLDGCTYKSHSVGEVYGSIGWRACWSGACYTSSYNL